MKGSRIPCRRGDQRGLIFNIQRFSLHDGVGIRTLVFLKGCPLRCRWCANPEGQSGEPELGFIASKCIGVPECGQCIDACEVGAIQEGLDGKAEIKRANCTNCGACVEACPAMALERFGTWMDATDVVRAVEEDGGFYARSGGGLTLSGGEPLFQKRFVLGILQHAQARGIHAALETSGFCPEDDLLEACGLADQVFYDIKCMDPERHRKGTGVGNERILSNLLGLSRAFPEKRIVVRTPVIPGFNDTEEDIQAVVRFLSGLPAPVFYELLPYHRFGEVKYRQLGRTYGLGEIAPLSGERMEALRALVPQDMRAVGAGS